MHLITLISCNYSTIQSLISKPYIVHTGDQIQLGICYFEGRGVESNPIIGAWYLYAAADQDCQRAIDIIRENDIPRPPKNQ